MITAIIVEDEDHCITRLQSLLLKHHAQAVHIGAVCKTIDEAVAVIKTLNPQLVFLDVQVADKTAFDLLQQLPEISFDIIFTTAYDQYAVQAFRHSALDYLLKPVDADDLDTAIKKLEEKISAKQTAQKLDTLFYNLKTMEGMQKRICLAVSTGYVVLQVADIIRCESSINYTTLFLKGGKKLTVAKTLKEFEKMLDDYDFFRVHNSHLINMACISSFQKGKEGTVVMSDGSKIEVSSRRKDDFIRRLNAQ